ncbi:hypothetical protein [Marivita sp.]|uniref:hypothetical protein n=1 Tax=Marivita sp. TaxID=2003365 RepID=UPI003F71CD05
MNWKECVRFMERYDLGDRFTWPPNLMGFDCEPDIFTISDVWGAISWVWTWPGDWILSLEPIRTFFEIEDQTALAAVPSIVIGWIIFLFLFTVVMGD